MSLNAIRTRNSFLPIFSEFLQYYIISLCHHHFNIIKVFYICYDWGVGGTNPICTSPKTYQFLQKGLHMISTRKNVCKRLRISICPTYIQVSHIYFTSISSLTFLRTDSTIISTPARELKEDNKKSRWLFKKPFEHITGQTMLLEQYGYEPKWFYREWEKLMSLKCSNWLFKRQFESCRAFKRHFKQPRNI